MTSTKTSSGPQLEALAANRSSVTATDSAPAYELQTKARMRCWGPPPAPTRTPMKKPTATPARRMTTCEPLPWRCTMTLISARLRPLSLQIERVKPLDMRNDL